MADSQKEAQDQPARVYAGFWKRFAAFAIDQVVVVSSGAVVGGLLGGLMAAFFGARDTTIQSVVYVAVTLIIWLYCALMESSGWQATLGKRAIGLQVVDLRGERISFVRATGRHVARFLSIITLMIGYLMAGVTRRKQALHDMVSGCLVVRNDRARGMPTWAVALAIFLGVLISMGGILAPIAIPAYQEYTVRAKVSLAAMESSQAKAAVTDFIIKNRRIPTTLDEAGLKFAPSDTVKAMVLNDQTGAIAIVMNFPPLVGKTLSFNPLVDEEKKIVWSCGSQDIPAKYLPAACRR